MDAVEFVKAIRRRWKVLAATILLALGVGWIGAETLERRSDQRTYRATATLLGSGRLDDPGIGNIDTLAALVTKGEVPVRVAQVLGFEGDPRRLTRGEPPRRPEGIVTTADGNTGIMTISATSTDPAEAELLANTFAGEIVGFLEGRKSTAAQAEAVKAQMDGLQLQIRDLDAAIAKKPSEILRAERDSKIRVYGFLYDQYQQLVLGSGASSLSTSLEIIEIASPQLITASFLGLPSAGIRMVVAPLIGLLGGLAIILLLERFDARIWAKPAAEQHLGFPVIAQIPFVKRRKRKALIVTSSNGGSAADAYRLLAASLARRAKLNAEQTGADNGTGRIGPEVILVTSPGAGEGKSTVAANLAVGLAELGEKVLAMSCDFRRSGLHRLFGIPEGHGLAEALASHDLPLDGKPVLDGFVRSSGFKDLGVIPSGSSTKRPGELLSSEAMLRALQEARDQSDVVVLDGPPTLVSETAHLLPKVDTVLVVARVGSSAEVAERASEQLRRLGANVAGIALLGTGDEGLPDYSAPTGANKKKHPRNLPKAFLRRAIFWRRGGSGRGGHVATVSAPSTGDAAAEAPPPRTDRETAAESPQLDREEESREKVHDDQKEAQRSDERLEPASGDVDPGGPLEPGAAKAMARQIAMYLYGGRPFVAANARDDAGQPSPQDEGPGERLREPGPGGEPMGDIPT
jgi:Mrp family chromosome partitioning ATPase